MATAMQVADQMVKFLFLLGDGKIARASTFAFLTCTAKVLVQDITWKVEPNVSLVMEEKR